MLAWYSVIAITPSLARSSFLKLASARARASSILVVNVLSYSADGHRCVRRTSSASTHSIYTDSFEFKAYVIGSMARLIENKKPPNTRLTVPQKLIHNDRRRRVQALNFFEGARCASIPNFSTA
jgi:hypothetical protein